MLVFCCHFLIKPSEVYLVILLVKESGLFLEYIALTVFSYLVIVRNYLFLIFGNLYPTFVIHVINLMRKRRLSGSLKRDIHSARGNFLLIKKV